VDDICCLVGKNESGKTSFLMAVELLNPAIGTRQIDIVRDYPAWLLAEGEKAMAAGDPPVVVKASYELSDDERSELDELFGARALTTEEPEIQVRYDGKHTWYFNSDEQAAVSHLVKKLGSPAELSGAETIQALEAAAATTEHEEPLTNLLTAWGSPGKLRPSMVRWLDVHQPAYVYFGEYSLMPGRVSVPALIALRSRGEIGREYRTFLALLDIAGTPLESFIEDANYEQQKRRLEAAGLRITSDLNTFWSCCAPGSIRTPD